VTDARLVRILALLAEGGTPDGTGRLCMVAAEVTGMDGAGIMLLSGDVPKASLCTTNATSTLIEDLQYTLGEGPCVDAHRDGTVTLEPDLADPAVLRWPAFAPPAIAGGARAVFGFPVRVGAARLGALNLYRGRPGALSDDQHADALIMADVAARAILASQADALPGQLAVDLEAGTNFHPVVHQAAGMVSIQLDVTVGEALIRLRARAFQTDRLVADVAADVVARRQRFDDPSDE
jgi:GAF domain